MNDDQTRETLEQLQNTLENGVRCPKCQRIFKSKQAFRVHHLRKHTNRTWNTTQNLKKRTRKKYPYPSSDPRTKREKYRILMDWYRSQGLNSHGKPYTSKKWQKRYAKQSYQTRPRTKRYSVWPPPEEQQNTSTIESPKSQINFCPNCGHDIKQYEK